MLNGKADMLWNSGNATVVLLKRPRASAFPRETAREWEYKVNFLRDAGELLELVWSGKKARMSKGDRQLLEQMVDCTVLKSFANGRKK